MNKSKTKAFYSKSDMQKWGCLWQKPNMTEYIIKCNKTCYKKVPTNPLDLRTSKVELLFFLLQFGWVVLTVGNWKQIKPYYR